MGAFLLSAGQNGKRLATPNAEIMIHQPLGGMQGQATDMEIATKHMLRVKENLNRLLAKHTGNTIDIIKDATDRDNWLTPNEALSFGIIDKIIMNR